MPRTRLILLREQGGTPIDPLDTSVTEALRAWRVQNSAGIDIAQTLENCATICDFPEGQRCFRDAAQRAAGGQGIDRLLHALIPILSEAERATIQAGWQSGRVDAIMDAAIVQRELASRARTRVRSKMMLPALMLLMAAFIAPLPRLILEGSVPAYLLSALLPLGLAALLWKAGSTLLSQTGRGIHGALLKLPLLGELERQRSVAEAMTVLSSLIGAGLILPTSLEICARSVRNTIYREDMLRCARAAGKGQPLSESFKQSVLWSRDVLAAIATGEKSGRLEETLAKLGQNARDSYARRLELFADWLPRMGYALVALFIIIQIVLMISVLGGIYKSVHVMMAAHILPG